MVIVASYILFPCSSVSAWHWTPPTPTAYWEAIYGYITGFTTLDADDEIAAFSVSDGTLVGHDILGEGGGNIPYSMFIYSDDATQFDVFFLVWDGSSEISAVPNFTAHPVGGTTQHNLENGVPEPSTILIMCLSILLIRFFIPRPSPALQRIE